MPKLCGKHHKAGGVDSVGAHAWGATNAGCWSWLFTNQSKQRRRLTYRRTPTESWKWYTNSLRQCSLLTGAHTLMEKRKKEANKLYKFVQTLSELHHYWLLLLDVEAPVLVHVLILVWLNMTRIRWEIIIVQYLLMIIITLCVYVCAFCVCSAYILCMLYAQYFVVGMFKECLL